MKEGFDQALLSVIVPVYNAEQWIERCLKSISQQTYTNLEILVVDDGSTDGSLQVIRQFANKDGRIAVFTQENGGEAKARETGIHMAKGQYITFVDADDYIDPDMYEVMCEVMERENADIVETGCRQVYPTGGVILERRLSYQYIDNSYECIKQYLLQKNIGNYLWNKVYRRSLMEGLDHNIPRFRYSVDFYLNAIIHGRAKKKITLESVYYNYMMHQGQITAMSFSFARLDSLRAGMAIADYYKEDPMLRALAAVYVCDYYFQFGKCIYEKQSDLWKQYRKKTRKWMVQSIWAVKKVSIADERCQVIIKRSIPMFLLGKKYFTRAGKNASLRICSQQKALDKTRRMYNLSMKWLQIRQEERTLADFFTKRGFQKIAIYGMADMGKALYRELTQEGIEVVFAVDKRKMELPVLMFTPDEKELPEADIVVVTALVSYSEIYALLKTKVNCPICSLEEVINGI